MKKRQFGTGKLIYAADINTSENYTVDNLQQLAQDASLIGIVSNTCLVTSTGITLNINIPSTICRDTYGNRLNITAQQFDVALGSSIPAILSAGEEQYITIYATYVEILGTQDVDINNNVYYKDHTDGYQILRLAGEMAIIGSAARPTLPNGGVLLADIWIEYPIGGSQTSVITSNNIKLDRQLLINSSAISGDFSITGDLSIGGTSTLSGNLTAPAIFSTTNPSTPPATNTQVAPIGYNDGRYVKATGSTMTGTLVTPTVNTSTGLVKNLTVSNISHLEGDTTIDGTVHINDNTTIVGNLLVQGNSTVQNGNFSIQGELLTTAVQMEWANSIHYTLNAIVSNGGKLWQCKTDHTSIVYPGVFTAEIANWGLAGGGGSTTQQITLVNHGFTLGQVLYYSSVAPYYNAAIANQTSTLGLFIVSSVIDANDFVIMQEGYFTTTGNPLVGAVISTTAYFVGSISGNTLTVTGVNSGTIAVGMQIGNNWVINGITVGTTITANLTGVGNTGASTWTISGSPQFVLSGAIIGMRSSTTFTSNTSYYLSDTFPGYMTTIAPPITQQVLYATTSTEAYVVSYTPNYSALYWVDEFAYVTGTSTYTLTYRAETKQSMMVIVAGVPQYNADYDINGTKLTLNTVYPNGAAVRVWYIYTMNYTPGVAIEEFKQTVPFGGATTFTLINQPISSATVIVSIDGIEQDSDSYTINGMSVVTGSTVAAGKKVRILNIYASRLLGFDPNNTPDNTIPGAKIQLNSNLSCNTFVSTVATGTPPFTVTSTDVVTHLDADMVDTYHATTASTASTIPVRDTNGIIYNSTVAKTAAIWGTEATGYGVQGVSTSGIGVYGSGNTYGMYGVASAGVGVIGLSTGSTNYSAAGTGVYGGGATYGGSFNAFAGVGVIGLSNGSTDYSTAGTGVYGGGTTYGGYFNAPTGTGVYGTGQNYGVYGTGQYYGVFGTGTTYGVYGTGITYGVYGTGTGGNGVTGITYHTGSFGVYGNYVGGGSAYQTAMSSGYLKYIEEISIIDTLKYKPFKCYKYLWEDGEGRIKGFHEFIGPLKEDIYDTFKLTDNIDGLYMVDGIALGLGIELLDKVTELENTIATMQTQINKLLGGN